MCRLAILLLFPLSSLAQPAIQPIDFSQVKLTDAFWKPRVETVAAVTVPVCIEYTENKTGRLRNFDKAARAQGEKHEGIFYDDSDVYKALEAVAYALATRRDPTLEAKADAWIARIAAAQQKDGYLNTYYTLTGLDQRWTDMAMHEDYCAGHLIEAAVAYRAATGKTVLLDVARRMVNHMMTQFGPGKRHWVTGHQELELALVKLYGVTGDARHLEFAHWLLEERGHGHGVGYTWRDWRDTAYCQDDVPVRAAREIKGHAVRAMYLYTGVADVAARTRDSGYLEAMHRVWTDVVHRNMYLTGGIGSSGRNEGFSVDYDLPNEQAYCETCASVGMVFWNQRMFQLTGDSRYIDVLERTLYNGALSGLSLSGDRFFYGNPLASSGQHARREWFGTACCPSNIARLVASIGGYMYAKRGDEVWVNLYAGSSSSVALRGGTVQLEQTTEYPWNGAVRLAVTPAKAGQPFTLRLRMPGWAYGEAVRGDLYRFANARNVLVIDLTVNGVPLKNYPVENGYAVISRAWQPGDVVELKLPMEVERVRSRSEVTADSARVALQRGPLVYCFEAADNGGKALNFLVPDEARVEAAWKADLLGGVMALEVPAIVLRPSANGLGIETVRQTVRAVPYHAWANRGPGQMQVWVPRRVGEVRVLGE